MAEWVVMSKRTNNSYELVFNPGEEDQERIAFTISEADLEDAISYGRVERDEPFDKQMSGCAYHKVMELNVCNDVERVCEQPWVVLQRGEIIARNFQAMSVTEDDLG